MEHPLMQRWLRTEWQVLDQAGEPPPPLAGGPLWEDDLDELCYPACGFACSLRARLADLLGGEPRQYWLEQRAAQLQWRLMQTFKPECRLLLGQREHPFLLQRLQGLGLHVDAPVTGQDLPSVDGLLEHWQGDTALVWLQSPSPLQGRGWSAQAVDELCTHLQSFSLVVVDLSLDRPRPARDWQQLMEQHGNLMLVREFDAHWGLSGLQLASLQAQAEWVSLLHRLWPEVQLSRAAERVALDLLTRENQSQADQAMQAWQARGEALLQAWQGHAALRDAYLGDFPALFLQPHRPAGLLSALQRQWPGFQCLQDGWFRIPVQNEALCETVQHWLETERVEA